MKRGETDRRCVDDNGATRERGAAAEKARSEAASQTASQAAASQAAKQAAKGSTIAIVATS